jgi:hypothetical protein
MTHDNTEGIKKKSACKSHMAEYLGDDRKSQTLDNLNVQQVRVKNCYNAIQ